MNKQQLESILNNAPDGMPQVHISEQFGVVYITVGGDDHNLSDLQTQLNQLNEIERLKSVISESVGFIDSFIDDHENKEVRLYQGSIDEYLDVRLDEHIDWSELVHALKELNK